MGGDDKCPHEHRVAYIKILQSIFKAQTRLHESERAWYRRPGFPGIQTHSKKWYARSRLACS